jgi:hypothetical protein
MCLNGVAVEVKWENLKSIDFFYFFFVNGDLKWVSIDSTTLVIQWVYKDFFWQCRKYSMSLYLM